MRQIAHPQEQIAGRTAGSGLTLSAQTQLGAFADTGRHVHFQRLGAEGRLQAHAAAATTGHLFQRQGQFGLHVTAAAGLLLAETTERITAEAAAAPAEQGLEKVRETRAVEVLAVEVEVHIFKARSALELLAMLPVGAELIVHTPLFRVFEHFVGFVDILEFVFGLLVARVQVRVVLAGQLLVGSGDLVRTGGTLHAQKFVIILVFYCHDALPQSGLLANR